MKHLIKQWLTLLLACMIILPTIVHGADVGTENDTEGSEVITHTVTFVSGCEDEYEPQIVEHGHTASEPNDPYMDGFLFQYWLLDNEPYDFSTPVTEDITLVAEWVMVTTIEAQAKDVEGEDLPADIIGTGDYSFGDNVTLVTPEIDGYEFIGWYASSTQKPYYQEEILCDNRTFETVAGEDYIYIAVYEKKEVITHTVSFESYSDDQYEPQIVEHGHTAAEPNDPYMDGYLFKYWSLDDEPYDFSTPVTEDITLVAQWAKVSMIQAVAQDIYGDTLEVQVSGTGEYYFGQEFTLIAPEIDGYGFCGWRTPSTVEPYYSEDIICSDYSFTSSAGEDTTYIALYRKSVISHTVTFITNCDVTFPSYIVDEGQTIQDPGHPYRDGYNFLAWTLNGEPYDFDIPVTSDLVLIAKWEAWNLPSPFEIKGYAKDIHGEDLPASIEGCGGYQFDELMELKAPEIEGYEFIGWYESKGEAPYYTGDAISEDSVFSENVQMDCTYIAVYKKAGINVYKVSFDMVFDFMTEEQIPPQIIEEGDTVKKPAAPYMDEYEFRYWMQNDVEYDFNTPVYSNFVLKAKWSQTAYINILTKDIHGNDIPFSYEGDGINYCNEKAKLEVYWDDNYEFVGWYVYSDEEPYYEGDILSDNKVFEPIVTTDETYVAVFKPKQYTITINASEGGNVTTNLEMAEVNSDIIVTIKPDDNCKLESLMYTPEGGSPVYYQGSDMEFSFTMPAANVTITAVFVRVKAVYSLGAYTTSTEFNGSFGAVTMEPYGVSFEEGTEITVNTVERFGYDFLGWYNVTNFDEGGRVAAYDAEHKLASSFKYTFAIAEDSAIVAVYQPKPKATISIECENNAGYTVGDDSIVQHGSTHLIEIGTELTIRADDASRVQNWLDENGIIIGTDASISFIVTGDTTITLAYKPEWLEETATYIEFITDYNQVLSNAIYHEASEITEDIFPNHPTKTGYTFDKWIFQGTDEEATVDTIKSKMGTGSAITIKPSYTKDIDKFSITVKYVCDDEIIQDDRFISRLPVGTNYTINAPEIDGYVFQCWRDADGKELSYKQGYYLQVTTDVILFACYGEEKIEEQPVIAVGKLKTITDGSTHKVSCPAVRSIPTGYTIVEQGVLYANVNNLTEDTFVYGTSGVKKYKSTSKILNGVVNLNVKVSNDNMVIYFRGYMILKDSSGEIKTYYSDMAYGSYNSIQNGN